MIKHLTAVLFVFAVFTGEAQAQFSVPLRVMDEGAFVTPTRYRLNCVGGGITCADNAANLASSITVALGAGGTLQTAYNNSAGAVPSIAMTTANAGVTLRDGAAGNQVVGSLFGVQNSTGATKYLDVTAASGVVVKSPNGSGTGFCDDTTGCGVQYGSAQIYSDGNLHLTNAGTLFLSGIPAISASASMTLSWSQAAATVAGFSWTHTGGQGGNASAPTAGGLGGAISITAGAGGSGAAGPIAAGNGGALTLAAGNGGAAGGGTQGNGGNVTINAGAGATQGTISIGATTASAINYGNGTITHAFTGSITDNTVAATFTHSAADAFGTTPTAYLTMANTTAAANGAQQFSPALVLEGKGWETSVGSSQTNGWQILTRPVQGATALPQLVFYTKTSTAGAYGEVFRLSEVNSTTLDIMSNLTTVRFRDSNANVEGFQVSTGAINFFINGTNTAAMAAGVFEPSSDNAVANGASALRWTTTFTLGVNSGASDLTLTPNANVTLAANKNLNGAAGTGALTLGSMTGDTTLPTGSISWTAASAKTLTLTPAGNSTLSFAQAGVTAAGFTLGVTGGQGGNANAGVGGGNGGAITITSGSGGTGAAGPLAAGNGAALNLNAGGGGAAGGGTQGNGGAVNINAGDGATAGSINIATTTGLAITLGANTSMSAQKGFTLGTYTTAQLPNPCTNGTLAWDSTTSQVKRCLSNAWAALGGTSEFNFSAFDSLTGTALQQPLSQVVVTNASTIASATFTVEVLGVGAGNYEEKLCESSTCAAANDPYVTCTTACGAAAGTVTSCTVNRAAVAAGTTLKWTGITACASNNPAFNVIAHFTNP